MLSVIDQHWREHLYEMDYLREGINLRAMGQRDPLAEWQREGFDMFEAMMEGIKDDFVRYIFRLEVVADEAPRPVRNLRYSAAEDPVQGSGGFAAAALAGPDRGARRRTRPGAGRRGGPDRSSRCGSRRRPAATSPATAAAARSTSSVMAVVPFGPDGLLRTPARGIHARLHRRSRARFASGSTTRTRTCASTTQRDRLAELEAEASQPDLWDDPDAARRVTTELSAVQRRRRARRRARRPRRRSRRRCTSSVARRPTTPSSRRSSPGSTRCAPSSTSSSCARSSPASTTTATRSAR